MLEGRRQQEQLPWEDRLCFSIYLVGGLHAAGFAAVSLRCGKRRWGSVVSSVERSVQISHCAGFGGGEGCGVEEGEA